MRASALQAPSQVPETSRLDTQRVRTFGRIASAKKKYAWVARLGTNLLSPRKLLLVLILSILTPANSHTWPHFWQLIENVCFQET